MYTLYGKNTGTISKKKIFSYIAPFLTFYDIIGKVDHSNDKIMQWYAHV